MGWISKEASTVGHQEATATAASTCSNSITGSDQPLVYHLSEACTCKVGTNGEARQDLQCRWIQISTQLESKDGVCTKKAQGSSGNDSRLWMGADHSPNLHFRFRSAASTVRRLQGQASVTIQHHRRSTRFMIQVNR